VDFSLVMDAHGMPAVFAERAIVHYRYRREPWQAVRQWWAYGRHAGLRYSRYLIEPPTVLDVVVVCYRSAKLALRDVLRRRRPVRSLVDVTYVLAEASVVWRNPAFWQPVCRREFPANPLLVQSQRVGRLAGLIRGRRGNSDTEPDAR
jgi:hypothetical protein